jgi:hypothetical protein
LVLELDEVDVVDSTDEDESVRSALRLSLWEGLVFWSCCHESEREVLLGGTVQNSALPLGVARLEVELEALVLKGRLEGFGVGRHFGRGLCVCVGVGWLNGSA